MSTHRATLDLPELQRLLHERAPAAYLVPQRLLRRLIKHDRDISGLGLQVPHHRSYVTTRDSVLRSLDHVELGLPADHELPAVCILIAAPTARELASEPREHSLLKLWRTLFHARIHVELEGRLHGVGRDEWRDRIRRIGQSEFNEIRAVLQQDRYLLPPADDRLVYIEFAAVFLELCYFARPLVPHYFPSLDQPETLEQMLAKEVDADRLCTDTRPTGAAAPEMPEEPAQEEIEVEPAATLPELYDEGVLPGVVSDLMARFRGESPIARFRALIRRAKKAGKRGNNVRAAINRMRASRVAPDGRTDEIRASALAELDRLAERLRLALDLDVREMPRWRGALRLLLEPASQGFWPAEARLLHDLQKVCLDSEHELYTTHLLDWAVSLGRRPIRRALPCERLVLRLRHLRTAARRVRNARLDDANRNRLASLLRGALRQARLDTRDRLRPVVHNSLDEVGMKPQNLPERAAASKLTEELLDRIEDQGFLTMGDLRDAVSRNNLKLPDLGREDRPAWIDGLAPLSGRLLAGAREFFRGDRILRADRRLSITLDGVYRHGEFYIRWLQRLSALAFGTRTGRFLTLYAALPFGGAFMLLFLCVEIRGYAHKLSEVMGWSAPRPSLPHSHHVHINWPSPWGVALLGLFFLGLLHWPAFRRAVGQGLLGFGKGLHRLCIGVPRLVLHWPPVRWVLESGPVLLFQRHVLKPLLCAGLAVGFLWPFGVDPLTIGFMAVATFLTMAVFFNTRLGRDFEEATTDWIVRSWRWLSLDLLPGLVRVILAFFKRLLEDVDRFLYRVDEWLRFRSGERMILQILKPVLGLVWFLLTYLVRFFINVIVEPQINPIKHFPVVTVSHKLVLALFVPPFAEFLVSVFGYEKGTALATAGIIGVMPPGLFGFLVWELKENWRLYRANQPPELRPVAIGHHGETMVRLLRPGIHSGTVPKLYARLRRAGRSALRDGEWRAFRRYRDGLHRAEEEVHAFMEREVAFLLNQSPSWGGVGVHAGAVTLCTNRVHVELCCPALDERTLEIVFEERAGSLRAAVTEAGWLSRLTAEQMAVFTAALAGLYKMTGVDVVCDCVSEDTEPERSEPAMQPLRQVHLFWDAWVTTWQAGLSGQPLLDGVRLLPRAPAAMMK